MKPIPLLMIEVELIAANFNREWISYRGLIERRDDQGALDICIAAGEPQALVRAYRDLLAALFELMKATGLPVRLTADQVMRDVAAGVLAPGTEAAKRAQRAWEQIANRPVWGGAG